MDAEEKRLFRKSMQLFALLLTAQLSQYSSDEVDNGFTQVSIVQVDGKTKDVPVAK